MFIEISFEWQDWLLEHLLPQTASTGFGFLIIEDNLLNLKAKSQRCEGFQTEEEKDIERF